MPVSTKGRYALRLLIDIAEHQSGGYLPLREVAARQDISEKYMEVIAKLLVKGGVLEGLRGKGGGYRLSRSPDHISVREVLAMTEGSLAPVACLDPAGKPCAKAPNCPTLPMWRDLERVVDEYLEGYTIQSLMSASEPGDYYVI